VTEIDRDATKPVDVVTVRLSMNANGDAMLVPLSASYAGQLRSSRTP